MGKRRCKKYKKILGIGLISGAIIAILFTLVALIIPDKIIAIFNNNPKVISEGSKYLKIVCISYVFTAITFNYSIASRCIQNSFLPMVVSSLALLCNVFFNYIFIFGHLGFKPMGVSGAALATLISRAVETIVLISYIYAKKGILAAKIKEMMNFTKEFLTKVVNTIITSVGILRGGGDTKYALIAEASTMWLIGVPLAFIGAFLFKLPVYLVYALVTIEEIVKFIVGLMRFLSKKWVKNVIKDM